VKFLIDAQLPARLAELLNQAGHDAVHTSGLPDGNRSTDRQIAERADADGRVLVTKHRDFRDGHLLARTPRQLLVVATGNITNNDLLSLFELHLGAVLSGFEEVDFAELSQDALALGGPAARGPRRQLRPRRPDRHQIGLSDGGRDAFGINEKVVLGARPCTNPPAIGPSGGRS
jgi:predicted nuclease of predicted toxin-antitoxin system